MTIHFYDPPPAQKTGGLDNAIQSLRRFLESQGSTVASNADLQHLECDESEKVVHFHGLWQPQFLKASRRCVRSRIPYVVSPHGMLEPWAWRHKYWKKLPYYYFFERSQLRNANMVLATSEQEAGNLSRFVSPDKIKVIPLGLTDTCQPGYAAARQKLGWDPDELVLLFLSRIHPKKGLHLLLRALGSMAGSLPAKWRLVIVGDGEERYISECLDDIGSNPALARFIEWKGAVWGDEKWLYHQGADLFCLPSFSENFGLAILEACQVGTRVLTTRNTPWNFLEDGRIVFLVNPEVESIKKGLMAFLKSSRWNQNDRDVLSCQIHDRFNWQTIGRQYMQLYQELAAISKPSGSHRES